MSCDDPFLVDCGLYDYGVDDSFQEFTGYKRLNWMTGEIEEEREPVAPCIYTYHHGLNDRKDPIDVCPFLEDLCEAMYQFKDFREKVVYALPHVYMYIFGKRNVQKTQVSLVQLSSYDTETYNKIKMVWSNPVAYAYVGACMEDQRFSRRLVNFFVVHYSLHVRRVRYKWLSREYPLRIELCDENGGYDVDLHDEYVNSKWNQKSPYRRSTIVHDEEFGDMELCESSFYTWFATCGGFEALVLLQDDVRAQKFVADNKARQRAKSKRDATASSEGHE